jgi:hypothetical protein
MMIKSDGLPPLFPYSLFVFRLGGEQKGKNNQNPKLQPQKRSIV